MTNDRTADVARLKAELKMVELEEKLEEARAEMHKDRSNRDKVLAYRAIAEKVHKARRHYRENHRVRSEDPNDASPQPETVHARGKPKPVEVT